MRGLQDKSELWPMKEYRNDFPILGRKIYEKYPLVYLDNAATTGMPP